MRGLEEELRRALLRYALTPVAVLAFFWIFWAALSWEVNIVERHETACARMETVFRDYLEDHADRLSAVAHIHAAELFGTQEERARYYEQLFQVMNKRADIPRYFLLDEDGKLLLSHEAQGMEKQLPWGMLARLASVDGMVVELGMSKEGSPLLFFGQVIKKDGIAVAYLITVSTEEDFQGDGRSSASFWTIADAMGRVPFGTLSAYYLLPAPSRAQEINAQELRRIPKTFAEGIGSIADEYFLVSKQPVLQDGFTLYVLTPLDKEIRQDLIGAGLLGLLLCFLVPYVFYRTRLETQQKMHAAREIIDAFHALKNGDLSARLNVHTGNEFEEIANSYNEMADNFCKLIELREEASRAQAVSELHQLEAQFHPHFLYNTLENIKFMITLAPKEAGQMIVALSKLLRQSVAVRSSTTTLQETLQHLRDYITIQKLRFGERLQYEEHIEAGVQHFHVPKFFLQPLIENAVKYGQTKEGEFHIALTIVMEKETLNITMKDTGEGIPEEKLEKLQEMLRNGTDGEHTGLYNVHRRIQLLYGEAYGIKIVFKNGTEIHIRFPAKEGSCADRHTC